jgi:putative photosynthetic complex assembly protein
MSAPLKARIRHEGDIRMSVVRFEGGELEKELIPPVAIKATAAFLALVLILAAVARLTGVGALEDVADRTPMVERTLAFVAAPGDGPVELRDGDTGELIQLLAPGEGGFLRGAVRPLYRERERAGGDPAAPWRLTRWSDGALTLTDPLTGMVVDLHAFGPTNAGAFAELLPPPPVPRAADLRSVSEGVDSP